MQNMSKLDKLLAILAVIISAIAYYFNLVLALNLLFCGFLVVGVLMFPKLSMATFYLREKILYEKVYSSRLTPNLLNILERIFSFMALLCVYLFFVLILNKRWHGSIELLAWQNNLLLGFMTLFAGINLFIYIKNHREMVIYDSRKRESVKCKA